jgi:phosphate uptake regulator
MSLFRSDDAIARMGEDFTKMLELTHDMIVRAGTFFFERPPSPDERTALNKQDVKVNKLERRIRTKVIAHHARGSEPGNVPFCLLLMSLVKDVERIGDYAKNLAETYDEGGGAMPQDDNADELRELRRIVEDTFASVGEVFSTSDSDSAGDLIRQGRDVNHRCDVLITRIAKGPYDAATTTTLVLGTRYYKRIESHLLNVLSGVVMPLHKLDYYDEKALGPEAGEGTARETR